MILKQEIRCNNMACRAVVATKTATTLRVSSESDVFFYAEDGAYKGICPKCKRGYRFVPPPTTFSSTVDGLLATC